MRGDEAGGVLVHFIVQRAFQRLYHEHLSCVCCEWADGIVLLRESGSDSIRRDSGPCGSRDLVHPRGPPWHDGLRHGCWVV